MHSDAVQLWLWKSHGTHSIYVKYLVVTRLWSRKRNLWQWGEQIPFSVFSVPNERVCWNLKIDFPKTFFIVALLILQVAHIFFRFADFLPTSKRGDLQAKCICSITRRKKSLLRFFFIVSVAATEEVWYQFMS